MKIIMKAFRDPDQRGTWRGETAAPLRSPWLPVGAITAAFVAVACIGIGDDSFWLDEAGSWLWATYPVQELVKATGEHVHAPTYYAALHGWIKLGVDSDVWIRALSVALMASTIPVVYLFGRVVESPRVGLTAATIFATSPFIYGIARDARPEPLLTLSAATALLIFAVGIRGYIIEGRVPAVVGLGWRQGRKHEDILWLGFYLSLLVAITTHHTGLVLLPILGGSWFLLTMLNRHRRVHLTNASIFVAALSVVYCLVFLPGFLESVGVLGSGIASQEVSFRYGLLMTFIIYGNGRLLAANVLYILPPLFALWKWRTQREWVWPLFFLTACLGMFAIVLLVGQVHLSVFKYRYFIWVTVPYFVLLGVGLSSMRPWLWRILLTAIVAANVFGIVMVHQSVKQPWEQLSYELQQIYKPGDAVVVCPAYNHRALFRYWDGPTEDLWVYNARSDQAAYLRPNLRPNLEDRRGHPAGGALMLAELVQNYPTVWLVASWHPNCRKLGDPVFDLSYDGYVWLTWRWVAYEGHLAIRKIDAPDGN